MSCSINSLISRYILVAAAIIFIAGISSVFLLLSWWYQEASHTLTLKLPSPNKAKKKRMGVLDSSGGCEGSCWLIYGSSSYNSISPCNEVIMKNWFREHNNCPALGRPFAFSLNQLAFVWLFSSAPCYGKKTK